MATISFDVKGGPGQYDLIKALSEPHVTAIRSDGGLTYIHRSTRFIVGTTYHDSLYVDINGTDRTDVLVDGKYVYFWELRGNFLVREDFVESTKIPESLIGSWIPFKVTDYDTRNRSGRIAINIPD